MATEIVLQRMSLPASADLSASQYHFTNINSSGQLAINTTAGGLVAGVLQDKPFAAGNPGNLGIGGGTKIILGGTVAAGANIASSATGTAVTAATGNVILGICVKGGAAGEIGEMIFNPANISA